MPNIHKMRAARAKWTPKQWAEHEKKMRKFERELAAMNAAAPARVNHRSIRRNAKLKKVAAKRKTAKKRARLKNPAPLMYIITAQGTGRKMSYDGTKFSERAKIRLFKTTDEAIKCAESLVEKYPLLRKYKVRVETNEHKPGK